MFIPVYEDKENKYRYIEALPKPGKTYIGYKSFSKCINLQHVIISNSVKIIGDSAFEKLNYVSIGNSVKTIENGAFHNCCSLMSAIIPKHLEQTVKELEVFPVHTEITVI